MEQLTRDNFISILVLLKLPDLIRLCKTRKQIENICNDQMFWQIKVRSDIPNNEIPSNIKDYRKFYFKYFVKYLNVVDRTSDDNQAPILFTIIVYRFDTYKSIWDKIMRKIFKDSPNRSYYLGYFNERTNRYITFLPTLAQITEITSDNPLSLSLWNDALYLYIDQDLEDDE